MVHLDTLQTCNILIGSAWRDTPLSIILPTVSKMKSMATISSILKKKKKIIEIITVHKETVLHFETFFPESKKTVLDVNQMNRLS